MLFYCTNFYLLYDNNNNNNNNNNLIINNKLMWGKQRTGNANSAAQFGAFQINSFF